VERDGVRSRDRDRCDVFRVREIREKEIHREREIVRERMRELVERESLRGETQRVRERDR